MDLGLDPEKAAALDCGTCNVKLQSLRNCSGTGTPAKVQLNNNIYVRCPRAMYLESITARHMVEVYAECRENKLLPSSGSISDQTQFTRELFNFLDNLVMKYRIAANKKIQDSKNK